MTASQPVYLEITEGLDTFMNSIGHSREAETRTWNQLVGDIISLPQRKPHTSVYEKVDLSDWLCVFYSSCLRVTIWPSPLHYPL